MWTRIVLVVVALAGIAHASPAAEKIFQDGKALLAAGKIAEACDAFRRSQELEPRVGTLLNLGDCEEKQGRIASAWGAFVDARALATRLGDSRAAVADSRASALALELSYLTLKVPGQPSSGLVVHRNGAAVSTAELGLETPVDPGHYDIVASAPGFLPANQSIDLAVGQRATIEIPALVIDPHAPAPAPAITTTFAPAQVTSHRIGLGAGIGLSSDGDVIYGGRVLLHLAPVGSGTIRAVPSVFLSTIQDPVDPYHHADLFALGFAAEYVATLAPHFIVAAGLGGGIDLIDDNYQERLVKHGWGAARFSPTLRLPHGVDLGVHVQLVGTKAAIIGLAGLGVDYFFW